ncbi:hypothetical protein MJ579_17380 [Klebsiella pneumoniae]|nr:hypothetical protein MJ579_17380 [Klebsiella pneumoniae]
MALEENNIPFEYQLGEGAFYGEEVVPCMTASIVHGSAVPYSWTSLPQRLAPPVGENNERQVPVMIHRAILGSLERFIGI